MFEAFEALDAFEKATDKIISPFESLGGKLNDSDLVAVDVRKRISLGKYARHGRYLITQLDDDNLLLTPVVVVPANHPAALAIKREKE
jgi:hypothetical protein